LSESLIEYPLQRCTTMFLAVLAVALAAHGNAPGLRRWRLSLAIPVRFAAAAAATVGSILLVIASYCQFEAEWRLDTSHAEGIDAMVAFNLALEANEYDPLDRRIVATLPVYVDTVLHQHSIDFIGRPLIDKIYREVDRHARNNAAALMAHAQYLLAEPGHDAEFLRVLADMKRGSSRVAAVYMLESRFELLHRQYAEALASATEGLKYADVRGLVPNADEGVEQALRFDQQVARAELNAIAQRQQTQKELVAPSH